MLIVNAGNKVSQNQLLQALYNEDKRLHDILDMIGRVAALDFSTIVTPGDSNDMIDAIAIGLNMLSEELNARVVEKSKLDEVNQKLEKFAYSTAHDLKSPLNSISGIIRIMQITLKHESQSDLDLYLLKLSETVGQMRNLVQGILDYSTMDSKSITKSEIDLNQVFNEIIETDQAFHQVSMTFPEPLPTVFFNKSASYQIVRNLVSNAVKYSDKQTCEITVTAKVVEGRYRVHVSDNGPGIDRKHHQEIFNLFNKVKSKIQAESHGIGLHMIKQVLEEAGERIWVESSPGHGATFVFTIKK